MPARLSLVLLISITLIGCAEDNSSERSVSESSERVASSLTSSDETGSAIENRIEPINSPSMDERDDSSREETQPLRTVPDSPLSTSPPHPVLSPPSDLMPPEQAVPGRTALASPASASPQKPFTTVRVFYGTNRRETGSPGPKSAYGSEPGSVSFGFCDVSIPRGHKVGELESPSIWRFEFREDPKKHVVLLRVLKRSQGEFLSALQRQVWGSMAVVNTPEGPALRGGEVFVFVHGYNNSFEDAARRTAQIAYDLKFSGAPVMYSWPSQAQSSLDAYRTDGRMAGWSEEHLIDFVSTVAQESGARRVHLIAHSMGNRIVSGALRRLVDQCVSGRIPKFNEVILSAPDIDAEYFKTAIAPRIVHSAERITIYSSSRDYALKVSSVFNPQARKRLGEAGDELTLFPEYANIDVIDATEVETNLFALNHSYHADSPTILADMSLLLQGYTTQERGLASVFNRLAWQIRNVGRRISEGVTPASRSE